MINRVQNLKHIIRKQVEIEITENIINWGKQQNFKIFFNYLFSTNFKKYMVWEIKKKIKVIIIIIIYLYGEEINREEHVY
jgi:hypothetical protein